MTSPAHKLQASSPKEESPASTNEVIEDVESQVAGASSESTWNPSAADSDGIKEASPPRVEKTVGADVHSPTGFSGRCRRCGRCGLSRRCTLCVAFLLATAISTLALLWPRSVSWKVTQIIIKDDALRDLIGAIMDSSFSGTARFELDAVVEAENNNMIGAQVGQGTFVVTKGPHTLAVATTEPLVVRRRENAIVKAHSVSTLTPESSKYLMDILPPKYDLTVAASGELPVTVGGMSLTIHVDCDVDVSVMKIMRPETRDDMVTGHRCEYSISR